MQSDPSDLLRLVLAVQRDIANALMRFQYDNGLRPGVAALASAVRKIDAAIGADTSWRYKQSNDAPKQKQQSSPAMREAMAKYNEAVQHIFDDDPHRHLEQQDQHKLEEF